MDPSRRPSTATGCGPPRRPKSLHARYSGRPTRRRGGTASRGPTTRCWWSGSGRRWRWCRDSSRTSRSRHGRISGRPEPGPGTAAGHDPGSVRARLRPAPAGRWAAPRARRGRGAIRAGAGWPLGRRRADPRGVRGPAGLARARRSRPAVPRHRSALQRSLEPEPAAGGDGSDLNQGGARDQCRCNGDLPGPPSGRIPARDGPADRGRDGSRRGAREREGQEPGAPGVDRTRRGHRLDGGGERGGPMTTRAFNTQSRRKEELVPRRGGELGIYVCGVTVYEVSHIGHGRSAIVFDVIRRYLRHRGHAVKFVKNFTDIDDKIIRRANQEGVSAREVSERYIAEYRTDMASLGVLPPDVEPKATEHIPQMIALIERLIQKGMAYPVDGDVYFEVRRFPGYGKLSGKNLEDLQAGARVEVDERKRDPLDFALWKATKPGEPSWKSPWGEGRPGWHLECSAMAMEYLGETLDVHGGGEDLIFPHHENEIAQAEAATGKPFVHYWMHNGFVNMDDEKMSKSLGNTLTIKDLVRRHDPEALRLYLLGTHYRNPLEFADERITEAGRALARLRSLKDEAERIAARGTPAPGPDGGLFEQVAAHRARFEAAMDDDFNTPQALGVLFDLARRLHTAREQVSQGTLGAGPFLIGVGELVVLAQTLGLLEGAGRRPVSLDPQMKARIESLVYLRQEARRQRDFGEADRLREELSRLGVVLEDTRDGTTWKLQS